MRKILFVFSSTEFYSGAEVVLFRLASCLRRNFECSGLFPNRGELYRNWRDKGLSAIVLPFIPAGRHSLFITRLPVFILVNLLYAILLFFEILQRKIDIVHINDIYNLQAMVASRLAGGKVVCHIHAGVLPPPFFKRMVLRLAALLSHQFVSDSKAVLDMWFGGKEIPQNATVLHSMHPDPLRFDPAKYVRKKSVSFDIGMVAKMCREKGHKYFVEAAKLLKDMGSKDFRCHIVGGKLKGHEGYYDEIVELIESRDLSNEFILHGMTTDVPRLLSELDVFVHTPDFEDPFPTVVLEAMMMEKPVVCFRVGGIPEQFIDGESGILIPFRDVKRIAEEIADLYKNPTRREALGRQARIHVMSEFSEKKTVEKCSEVYGKLFKR